jgi:hypothetical protein
MSESVMKTLFLNPPRFEDFDGEGEFLVLFTSTAGFHSTWSRSPCLCFSSP